MVLHEYEGKAFKNVSAEDARVQTDEEKAAAEKRAEENKTLLEKIKAILGDQVKDVRLSASLKNHPVCITRTARSRWRWRRCSTRCPARSRR